MKETGHIPHEKLQKAVLELIRLEARHHETTDGPELASTWLARIADHLETKEIVSISEVELIGEILVQVQEAGSVDGNFPSTIAMIHALVQKLAHFLGVERAGIEARQPV
jgi:hypothetical protein